MRYTFNACFQILVDETGLNYVCQTAERFFAVSNVLSNMVTALVRDPSVRLLKHIIRCYLRLSENPYDSHLHLQRVTLVALVALQLSECHFSSAASLIFCRRARDALRHCLPEQLRSPQFTACLRDDAGTRRWLVTLIQNLSTEQASTN